MLKKLCGIVMLKTSCSIVMLKKSCSSHSQLQMSPCHFCIDTSVMTSSFVGSPTHACYSFNFVNQKFFIGTLPGFNMFLSRFLVITF